MKIIPAIDILNGRCVRLSQGDYNRVKIYDQKPLEVAKEFESIGIKYIHRVDLDGARSSKVVNYKVLEKLARQTSLHIDFGGGIKSEADINCVFDSGASEVSVGSIAVKNQSLFLDWLTKYGPHKINLAADCFGKKIASQGWLENNDLDVIHFISRYIELGVKNVICTDIEKDGMLEGPSVDLYREVLDTSDVNLIASGGVRDLNDIENLFNIGCSGVIIGKAIYEGCITLKELEKIC